jgi:hypothetical protein
MAQKMDLVSKRKMCFCCHKNKLALLPMVAKSGNRRKVFQIKSRVRPISILPYAYLPEHYKIETGSRRS